MAAERQLQGAAAEAAALLHLQHAGLSLLARNQRYRGGELDLVMREGDTTVFVEVRYRRSAQFGGGAASIDLGKRRRLVHAAQQFLLQHPALATQACRFDVVQAAGQPLALEWLRDAFRADD